MNPSTSEIGFRKQVLLVEDDPALRGSLADVLAEEGYEITCARNGLEAIRMLQEGSRASVILLDLSMPVLNGWEFRIHQLRTPAIAGIPVVIVTGGQHSREELAWLRPAELIQKPIDFSKLLAAIRRLADQPVSEKTAS